MAILLRYKYLNLLIIIVTTTTITTRTAVAIRTRTNYSDFVIENGIENLSSAKIRTREPAPNGQPIRFGPLLANNDRSRLSIEIRRQHSIPFNGAQVSFQLISINSGVFCNKFIEIFRLHFIAFDHRLEGENLLPSIITRLFLSRNQNYSNYLKQLHNFVKTTNLL